MRMGRGLWVTLQPATSGAFRCFGFSVWGALMSSIFKLESTERSWMTDSVIKESLNEPTEHSTLKHLIAVFMWKSGRGIDHSLILLQRYRSDVSGSLHMIRTYCFALMQLYVSTSSNLLSVSQNHEFVDEKTYEASSKDTALMKQVSRSSSVSSSSSPHGLTSCCARKKRKTFNVPNSKMSVGLQGNIQELSTIQIRERPLTNRYNRRHSLSWHFMDYIQTLCEGFSKVSDGPWKYIAGA